jgi:hypothetical protein
VIARAFARSLGIVGERGDMHDRASPDEGAGDETRAGQDDLGPEPDGVVRSYLREMEIASSPEDRGILNSAAGSAKNIVEQLG